MKTQFLFLLALLPLTTFAREVPQPFDICSGFACPQAMQEISTEFLAAGGIELSQIPFVASGECYHRDRIYDPAHKHYGVTLLDLKDGILYSGGSFGFFYKEDPYADWTVESGRAQSPNLYTSNHVVSIQPTFGFADMNPEGTGNSIVLYWYRQTPTNFYVLGIWGGSHAHICRFQKHAQ